MFITKVQPLFIFKIIVFSTKREPKKVLFLLFDNKIKILHNIFVNKDRTLWALNIVGKENNFTMEENQNVVETQQNNLTFDEVLSSNKEYQREFDRRLQKSNQTYLENQKVKWEQEYNAKMDEAKKLAQMDTEQKLNYRISQLEKENKSLTGQVNASSLMKTTGNILSDSGIPLNYLNMFDFEKETAETIQQKIEILKEVRSQDLKNTLTRALRQEPPKQVKSSVKKVDPYIEGFLSEI